MCVKIIINKALLQSNSIYAKSQYLWNNHSNVVFELDIDFDEFIHYLPNLLKYPSSNFSEAIIENIFTIYWNSFDTKTLITLMQHTNFFYHTIINSNLPKSEIAYILKSSKK